MEKLNSIESVTPHSGEYSFKRDARLNAWLAVTIPAYLVALFLVRKNPEWPALTRGLVGLVPLIPGLLYVRSWTRFVRGLDEMQRRIQLEAFLFAALGTVFLGVIVSTLAEQGLVLKFIGPGLGLGSVFMAMFTLWLVGTAIANCRYK